MFKIIKFAFQRFKKLLCAKWYDDIILLGYNCETAYRFVRYYKSIDSNLFTWSSVSLDALFYALRNLDKVAAGDFSSTSNMWMCLNTQIYFHGKEPDEVAREKVKLTEEEKLEYKKEVIERTRYLREKFKKTLAKNSKKLFILKLKLQDSEMTSDIAEKINNLFAIITEISTESYNLLVILEKKFYSQELENMLSDKKIIIRTVEYYAPDDKVISAMGHSHSWTLLFDEFRLKKWPKKKKTQYKFGNV